jgi:hypothetical protein
MHTAPMRDSDGDFGKWQRSAGRCRKCLSEVAHEVFFRRWDSHCGGYSDLQYKCLVCNYTWWVEGPDS